MSEITWTIRNFRAADFDRYAQLHRQTAELDRSGHSVSRQMLLEAMEHPNFSPESDLFVAENNPNQRLLGYASVFREPMIGRALLDGLVHPLNRRMGIGTGLFKHAVERARFAGLASVQICIPESSRAAQNMLRSQGLKFFRHFRGYRLKLGSIRLPDFKAGKFAFRSLKPEETDDLTAIQNRSFADTWGFNANTSEEISYRINSSSCSPENIIMVYAGARPVAYCWTRIHNRGIKGEIHMLGVDPDYRRQSIGRNVLTAGLSYLKDKGVETVELMADGEMPAALALYESAGFTAYIRTEWYEKKL